MNEASELSWELGPKRVAALAITDAMPRELRECVHEFGLPIVTCCVKHGVSSPRKIRELVKEIWAGARQTGQRNEARGVVDWLLAQSGSSLSFRTLSRLLAENHLVICTAEPNRQMLSASMGEVCKFNERMTKEEKHRRRLRAALQAAMKHSVS